MSTFKNIDPILRINDSNTVDVYRTINYLYLNPEIEVMINYNFNRTQIDYYYSAFDFTNGTDAKRTSNANINYYNIFTDHNNTILDSNSKFDYNLYLNIYKSNMEDDSFELYNSNYVFYNLLDTDQAITNTGRFLYSNLLANNPKRLAYIHYARYGAGSNNITKVDLNFNPELYYTFHPQTISQVQLYKSNYYSDYIIRSNEYKAQETANNITSNNIGDYFSIGDTGDLTNMINKLLAKADENATEYNISKNLNVALTLNVTGIAFLKSNVNIGSNLHVSSSLTIGTTSYLSGATEISDTLTVKDKITALSNLEVRTTSYLSGATDISDKLTVKDKITTLSNLEVGTTSYLSGATNISDTLTVKDKITTQANLEVGTTSYLSGATNISDTLTVKDKITTQANLEVGTTSYLFGATEISDTLTVKDTITTQANLEVGTTSYLSGATEISDTLTVKDKIKTLSNLEVGTTSYLFGATEISNTLTVKDKITTLSNLEVGTTSYLSGATEISDKLTVKDKITTLSNLEVGTTSYLFGATDISNTLTVKDKITTLSNLEVGTTSYLSGATDISDTLTVKDKIKTLSNLEVGTTSYLSGATEISDTLTVKDKITAQSNLEVGTTSYLSGATDISDKLTVKDKIIAQSNLEVRTTSYLSGATDISDKLTVKDKITAQSNLEVRTTSYLSGATEISDKLTVKDTITAKSNLEVQTTSYLSGATDISDKLTVKDTIKTLSNLEVGTTSYLSGAVHISNSVSIQDNLIIGGNLFVNGTTTNVNTETLTIEDNIIMVNSSPSVNEDGGYFIRRYQTENDIGSGKIIEDSSDYKVIGFVASTLETNNEIKLDTTNSIIDDEYKDWIIHIYSGNGNGQVRIITAYNAQTQIATVSTIWSIKPVAGDGFKLFNKRFIGLVYDESANNLKLIGTVSDPTTETSLITNEYADLLLNNLTASNNILASNNLQIGGTSYLFGSTYISDKLTVKDKITAKSNLEVGTTSYLSGATDISDKLTVKDKIKTLSNLEVGTTSYLSGATEISDKLTVKDKITTQANLEVGTTSYLFGATEISNTLTVKDKITAKSNLEVGTTSYLFGATEISDKLTVKDKITTQANLEVGTTSYLFGATEISNTLTVKDKITTLSNLEVGTTSYLFGATEISDTLTVKDKITTLSNLEVGTTSYLFGATEISDKLTVKDKITTLSNLEVGTTSYLSGATDISDTLTVKDKITTLSNLEVGTTSYLSGATEISNTLTVKDKITTEANLEVRTTSYLFGATDISDKLTVKDKITTLSNLEVGTTSYLSGATEISNTLTVKDKITTLSNLEVGTTSYLFGATEISDTLTVKDKITTLSNLEVGTTSYLFGATDISNTLTVKDKITTQANLEVGTTSYLFGATDISNTLTVKDKITTLSNLEVGTTSYLFGATDISNTLTVKDKITTQANLEVGTTSYLFGATDISNTLTVKDKITTLSNLEVGTTSYLSGATEISNTLTVKDTITAKSNLNVSGITTFSNEVIIQEQIKSEQDLLLSSSTNSNIKLRTGENVRMQINDANVTIMNSKLTFDSEAHLIIPHTVNTFVADGLIRYNNGNLQFYNGSWNSLALSSDISNLQNDTYLKLSGDTAMTGTLNMGGNNISNINSIENNTQGGNFIIQSDSNGGILLKSGTTEKFYAGTSGIYAYDNLNMNNRDLSNVNKIDFYDSVYSFGIEINPTNTDRVSFKGHTYAMDFILTKNNNGTNIYDHTIASFNGFYDFIYFYENVDLQGKYMNNLSTIYFDSAQYIHRTPWYMQINTNKTFYLDAGLDQNIYIREGYYTRMQINKNVTILCPLYTSSINAASIDVSGIAEINNNGLTMASNINMNNNNIYNVDNIVFKTEGSGKISYYGGAFNVSEDYFSGIRGGTLYFSVPSNAKIDFDFNTNQGVYSFKSNSLNIRTQVIVESSNDFEALKLYKKSSPGGVGIQMYNYNNDPVKIGCGDTGQFFIANNSDTVTFQMANDGTITNPHIQTIESDISTLQSGKLDKSGGTISGNLTMASNKQIIFTDSVVGKISLYGGGFESNDYHIGIRSGTMYFNSDQQIDFDIDAIVIAEINNNGLNMKAAKKITFIDGGAEIYSGYPSSDTLTFGLHINSGSTYPIYLESKVIYLNVGSPIFNIPWGYTDSSIIQNTGGSYTPPQKTAINFYLVNTGGIYAPNNEVVDSYLVNAGGNILTYSNNPGSNGYTYKSIRMCAGGTMSNTGKSYNSIQLVAGNVANFTGQQSNTIFMLAGNHIRFEVELPTGTISGNRPFGTFTGAHLCEYNSNITSNDIGKLLEIESTSLDTINDNIFYVKLCNTIKSKKIIGIYTNNTTKFDSENICHNVNGIGEGGIKVCSHNGDLEIGDFLVSCYCGCAMKQDDDILRNYTVAKTIDSVNWNEESETEKLIGCIYLCS